MVAVKDVLIKAGQREKLINKLKAWAYKYDRGTSDESKAKAEKVQARDPILEILSELKITEYVFPRVKVMKVEKGGKIPYDVAEKVLTPEQLKEITKREIDMSLISQKVLDKALVNVIDVTKAKKVLDEHVVQGLIIDTVESIQVIPIRQKGEKK